MNTPANNQRPYQYVGQLGYFAHGSDQGTALAGLLQLGVRFYDPEVGRFTQVDPLDDARSRYSYALPNPIRNADPSGLVVVDCNPSPRCNAAVDFIPITKRIEQLNDIMRGGTPPSGGGPPGHVAAITECACRGGKSTPITRCGASYWQAPPCLQLCLNEHEQTHREQCVKRGRTAYSDLYTRNPWNLETDAYNREIQCLRRLLGENP